MAAEVWGTPSTRGIVPFTRIDRPADQAFKQKIREGKA